MPGAAPGFRLHEREHIFRAQAEDVAGNKSAAETVFCRSGRVPTVTID